MDLSLDSPLSNKNVVVLRNNIKKTIKTFTKTKYHAEIRPAIHER